STPRSGSALRASAREWCASRRTARRSSHNFPERAWMPATAPRAVALAREVSGPVVFLLLEPPETSPQPLLRDEYVPVLIARSGIALPDLHRHAETGPAVLQVQAVVREIGFEHVPLDGVIEPGRIPVPVRADRLYPAGHLHDRGRVAERRGVHAL